MIQNLSNTVEGPLGINFLVGSEFEVIQLIEKRLSTGAPAVHIHLVNAYTISIAKTDRSFLEVLRGENAINLIDSFWLAKVVANFTKMIVPQCRGPLLFKNFLEKSPSTARHFLLGGDDLSLREITLRARASTKRKQVIAGFYAPEHQPLEHMDVRAFAKQIRKTNSDLIWVGLGTPKQDFVASQLTPQTERTSICVGAAFDFYSGGQIEAPEYLRKFGLEWFFRLATEPRRLWRRYLIGNLIFLKVSVKYLRGKK